MRKLLFGILTALVSFGGYGQEVECESVFNDFRFNLYTCEGEDAEITLSVNLDGRIPFEVYVGSSPYYNGREDLVFMDTYDGEFGYPREDRFYVSAAEGEYVKVMIFDYSDSEGNYIYLNTPCLSSILVEDIPNPEISIISQSETNLCTGEVAVVEFSMSDVEYLEVNRYSDESYDRDEELTGKLEIKKPGDHTVYFGSSGFHSICRRKSLPIKILDVSTCGELTGLTYLDINQNCEYDKYSGDKLLKNRKVLLNDGEFVTYTDEKGEYYFNLPYGDYTLSVENEDGELICKNNTTLTISEEEPLASHDFGIQMEEYHETKVAVSSTRARPDREMVYTVNYDNWGTFDEVATIKLGVDPLLGFVSATPNDFVKEGDSLVWTINDLKANEDGFIQVTYKVPADVTLTGEILHSRATISTDSEEFIPENNSNSDRTTIVNSYDPNDITLMNTDRTNTSDILLDEDEWLTYRIRFQNKGTAEAFDIVVRDTLPEEVDVSTLVVEGASHEYRVTVEKNNVLKFIFNDINLPDDKTDELGSHGWIKYHIKQAEGNELGDFIKNQADIYFDINPEVVTNETSNKIGEKDDGEVTGTKEREVGNVQFYPNPVSDVLHFRFPEDGNYDVKISNASGKLIQTFTLSEGAELITEEWERGVYFITIENQDTLITKKIVK